jgi:uncharacterized protein YjbI with pentapeptide repeats
MLQKMLRGLFTSKKGLRQVSKADYDAGLTIEGDEFPPKLTIDGQLVEGVRRDKDGFFSVSEHPQMKARTLYELGQQIIDRSPELKHYREAIRNNHTRILSKGVEHWNTWRREAPSIRPLLFGADLRGESLGLPHLNSVNFANANLINSNLTGMDLTRANFHEANLGRANLSYATLTEANFCRTDLYRTNLSHAILHQANLQGTQLAMTDFTGSELIGCRIYGMSAWDLVLDDKTRQEKLVILYRRENEAGEVVDESHIIVDNLEVAQFIYLLLHNEKIRKIIDTITSKVVLILGRFTPERKAILDRLREALKLRNYSPVIFDFEKPASRNLTETISTLAHMARFVVADITDAKSIPQELQRIVPDLPSVPVQPLLHSSFTEYAMFRDLFDYPTVLTPHRYDRVEELLASLDEKVIMPAVNMAKEIEEKRKAFEMASVKGQI